jgi:hypothetical protein
MTSPLYRKLYNAYMGGRGVQLTAEDVSDLFTLDDAVQTRWTNAACQEAGVPEAGESAFCQKDLPVTWAKFVKQMKQ